jgi:hypothetical protein
LEGKLYANRLLRIGYNDLFTNQNFAMRKVSLLWIMILGGTVLQAQENLQGYYGVKAGGNFYTIAPGGDGVSARSALHAGAFYHYTRTKVFSIQTELLYSMEGYKFSDNIYTVVTKLDYLDLPVLFQFNTHSGLYFETGPQVGLKLDVGYSYGGDPGLLDPVRDDLNKLILSGCVGAGYFRGKLGLGARYNFGISNISKNVDGRSNGLAVSLLYAFRLKRLT